MIYLNYQLYKILNKLIFIFYNFYVLVANILCINKINKSANDPEKRGKLKFILYKN